jgi:hypothetical protein
MVRSIKLITAATAIATVLATVGIVHAEKGNSDGDGSAKQIVELPAIIVWGKAKRNAYPHTEASDTAVLAPRANYTPELAFIRQASSASFDDIYWQLSKVTLADSSKADALKSEEEKLATEATRFVTTEKTRILSNCPIITSSQGERRG